MRLINLTSHDIVVDGLRLPPSGTIMRVERKFRKISDQPIRQYQEFYEIFNMPPRKNGVLYVASMICVDAARSQGRDDFVYPAVGHEKAIKSGKRVISVPGVVVKARP